jgi:hypothetical protein
MKGVGTMKRLIVISLALSLFLPVTAFCSGLDNFLDSVNVQARADLSGFAARISAQFGAPMAKVQAVIQTVRQPADAFMVYQLSQFSGREPERVMDVYSRGKGKGWGVIAKELGIKPGSAEFHALKRGDLHFTGRPSNSDDSPGKGKGKGHGKGHNK